ITRIPTSAHVVALTFDAGANADGLPSILATLRATGVRATFLLTGTFTSQSSALAIQIARTGYRIGNHSVDHPHFPQLTEAEVDDDEVLGAAQTITRITGVDPAPLFRFPYGSDARTV